MIVCTIAQNKYNIYYYKVNVVLNNKIITERKIKNYGDNSMANMTRDALRSLIGSRVDIALERLEEKLEYLKICKEQEESGEIVEEFYQQFEKSDRITIRRHYEGEVEKTNLEIKEVYLQGIVLNYLPF